MRFSGALAPHPCRFLVATGDEMAFVEFHQRSSFARTAAMSPEKKVGPTRVRVSRAHLACVRMSNRLGLGNVRHSRGLSSISVMET